jgi:type II secretory pathway pseudopilin PulG
MRRRQAFTIVEMLVSVALILFIMVILTEAFSSGMETFRQLKAIGDMQQRLRSTTTLLRRDLSADHFEGRRRLGDVTFWQDGNPALGFFHFQGGQSWPEGRDLDLTLAGPYANFTPAPFRSPSLLPPNSPTYQMSFSVKLRGNGRESFFSASAPPGSPLLSLDTGFYGYNLAPDSQFLDTSGTYNSQWAEVTYFLWPNGTNAGTNTPLYTLWRSQLVVVPDNRNLAQAVPTNQFAPPPPAPNYYDMSCFPNGNFLYFPAPGDLTNPAQRAFLNRGQFNPGNPAAWGATPLLSDVVSFDVRALYYTPAAPEPLNRALPLSPTFVDVVQPQQNANAPRYFDTADPIVTGNFSHNYTTVPQPVVQAIKALQVSIRLWELRTQQTRQVTIIQDM